MVDLNYFISPRHSYYDFMMAIKAFIEKSMIKWMTRHIKGHQNEDPYKVLDRWAKLNVQVDILAKASWRRRMVPHFTNASNGFGAKDGQSGWAK